MIMSLSNRLFRTVAAATALTLAACASTELVNQWSNPAYTSPSFKKIMVIGVTKQAGIRRTFEDEFVAQLKAAGVSAIPSYLYIPQDGPVGEAVLKQALKEAGADAVMITRLVGVQKKTEIAPGYYPPDPAMAVHPLYTTAWNDYYEPPIVTGRRSIPPRPAYTIRSRTRWCGGARLRRQRRVTSARKSKTTPGS
jgi:hypothetical protein